MNTYLAAAEDLYQRGKRRLHGRPLMRDVDEVVKEYGLFVPALGQDPQPWGVDHLRVLKAVSDVAKKLHPEIA